MRLFAIRVIVPRNKDTAECDVVTEIIEADIVQGNTTDLAFFVNRDGRNHLSSQFVSGSWLYFTEIFPDDSAVEEKDVDHVPGRILSGDPGPM